MCDHATGLAKDLSLLIHFSFTVLLLRMRNKNYLEGGGYGERAKCREQEPPARGSGTITEERTEG